MSVSSRPMGATTIHIQSWKISNIWNEFQCISW